MGEPPTQPESITLRRRGQRGNPGFEEYRVEDLHNRRTPLVGDYLTPSEVDDLIADDNLGVTILASK